MSKWQTASTKRAESAVDTPRPPDAEHPTAKKLKETVIILLKDHLPSDISVATVLDESKVSSGSLYHHFKDLNDLLDRSMVSLYSSFVDASIEFMNHRTGKSQNINEYRAALHAITRATQGPKYSQARATRSWILSESTHRPGLKKLLEVEQERLTSAIAEIARRGQAHGWVRKDIDPIVLANFIQAYTLGQIIDDISSTRMDIDKWNNLIDLFVDRVVLTIAK